MRSELGEELAVFDQLVSGEGDQTLDEAYMALHEQVQITASSIIVALTKYTRFAQRGRVDMAQKIARDEVVPALRAVQNAITAYRNNELDEIRSIRKLSEVLENSLQNNLLLLAATTLVAFVFAIGIIAATIRSISLPLRSVRDGLSALVEGRTDISCKKSFLTDIQKLNQSLDQLREHLESVVGDQSKLVTKIQAGEVNYQIQTDIYTGVFKAVIEGLNQLVQDQNQIRDEILQVARSYAGGEFSADMRRLPGDLAPVSETMDDIKASLVDLQVTISSSSKAAIRGDFSVTLESEGFRSGFLEIANDFNQLLSTAHRSFGEISSVLSSLSRGDLTARVEGAYQGQFDILARAVNQTGLGFLGIVSELQATAVAIGQVTQLMNGATAELLSGSNEQRNSISAVGGTIEALTQGVSGNLKRIGVAATLATEAREAVESGKNLSTEANQSVKDIAKVAKRMESIIDVIDAISFQTNLLALNASVEAARAGEHGKGFSVVASEVRALAQRSTTAANEIRQLINNTAHSIKESSGKATQVQALFVETSSAVNDIFNILTELSSESDEQHARIEDVVQSYHSIESLVQRGIDRADQVVQVADQLAERSEQLLEKCSGFVLKNSDE